MTVQGRSRDTTRAIAESAARLGVESSNDWIDGYAPQFVDFPFTDESATFEDHLRIVKGTCPALTVAPDVECSRSLSDVVEQADQLRQYARDVVIVPKSVHPSEVPSRFRVGVPLANFGSGAPWSTWDYHSCREVHLLGGGAAKQRHVGKHMPATIASVDTATMGLVSRFGYWDDGTKDAPGSWDYRHRLRESLNNYVSVWA